GQRPGICIHAPAGKKTVLAIPPLQTRRSLSMCTCPARPADYGFLHSSLPDILNRGILVLTLETLLARAIRSPSRGPGRGWARLGLDHLEERAVPAAFVVNGLGDTGTGSGTSGDLRYCITQSNSTGGPNTITFAPGVAGNINLTGELPAVTNSVTIQGPG